MFSFCILSITKESQLTVKSENENKCDCEGGDCIHYLLPIAKDITLSIDEKNDYRWA